MSGLGTRDCVFKGTKLRSQFIRSTHVLGLCILPLPSFFYGLLGKDPVAWVANLNPDSAPSPTCVTAVVGLGSFCEMGSQCGLTYLQWPPWGLREKWLTPSYCRSFGTITPGLGEASSISQASVGLVRDVQMSYIGWGSVLLPQSRERL